jgi:hypothetical protein
MSFEIYQKLIDPELFTAQPRNSKQFNNQFATVQYEPIK